MQAAMWFASSGGTAFPIILYQSPRLPINSKLSGNVWSLAASLTVIDLACFGSGWICLNPSLYKCAGIRLLIDELLRTLYLWTLEVLPTLSKYNCFKLSILLYFGCLCI